MIEEEMTQKEVDRTSISPLAAIIAIVVTFVLFLFLGTALAILLDYTLVLVFGELLLIVVPLGYMFYKKVNIKDYIRLEATFGTVILGVAFGVLLFFFDLIVSSTLVSIFGISETIEVANELILALASSTQGLLSLVVAMSLAGVCEEFTFRGFLQTAVNSKYSFGVALLVSSLVFGLFHFDPQGVYSVSAFLLGLVLGYLYHRWQSYVVPAIAHATLNLIVLAVYILM